MVQECDHILRLIIPIVCQICKSQSNTIRPMCVRACVLECCSRIGCTHCCSLLLSSPLFLSVHSSPLLPSFHSSLLFCSFLSSSTSLSPPLSSHILLYFPLPCCSLLVYHFLFLIHNLQLLLLSIHSLVSVFCIALRDSLIFIQSRLLALYSPLSLTLVSLFSFLYFFFLLILFLIILILIFILIHILILAFPFSLSISLPY